MRSFRFSNKSKPDFDFSSPKLGIYIHAPFCRKICSFCPYYKTQYDEELAKEYVVALLKELWLRRPLQGRPVITSLYVGGGSPALLLKHFPAILAELERYYNLSGNLGMELHPDDLTEENIALLCRLGFDMVSIGIQSFDHGCLASLGREERDYTRELDLVKQARFKAVDIDLIFGLPGQTTEQLKADFKTACELGATQISTYPFIDFSYTKHQRPPASRKRKKELLATLARVGEELGYDRTSVWNFAKQGSPRYSSVTRDSFIGFGPSAVTLSKDFFSVNTFSVEEYIKVVNQGQKATALTLDFKQRARELYWLFWSCYNLDIDRVTFKELFGRELDEVLGRELRLAVWLKLLEQTEQGYRLTEQGAYYFHLVEQHYTHQYIDKTWRICTAQPWPEGFGLW